jgi:hypothetical protein
VTLSTSKEVKHDVVPTAVIVEVHVLGDGKQDYWHRYKQCFYGLCFVDTYGKNKK